MAVFLKWELFYGGKAPYVFNHTVSDLAKPTNHGLF